MSEITILKLGGSVITDKSMSYAKANEKNIALIVNEILNCKKNFNHTLKLIIVHGAGSFGHPIAKKYQKTNKGINLEGVYEIHESMKALNELIVKSLRAVGIKALPVPTMGLVVAEDLRIISMQTESIYYMLENGFVPVLHGDVVMDKSLGASILSGDQLISYLGTKLNAKRIGISSNVDGVLDEYNKVIKKITESNFKSIEMHIKGSEDTDVTGGMREKVIELLNLTKMGFTAHIFNATVPGNISKFLDGKNIGTEIR